MADFIYAVNERDAEKWGTDDDVLGYFGGLRSGATDSWYLGNSWRLVKAGDRIWVYAAAPHSRVVAVGLSLEDPTFDDGISQWCIPIRWDRPVTRTLLRGGGPPVTAPRGPRRISDEDLHSLLTWLEGRGAPKLEELPGEVVERYSVVRARQGQQDFRRSLIEAYGGRCAITGCALQGVLEAAHIEGYTQQNSVVTNGLLLRADIHQLFDLGLIWIDGNYRIRVSSEVTYRQYKNLDGNHLGLPEGRDLWPDKEKLRRHRETARR